MPEDPLVPEEQIEAAAIGTDPDIPAPVLAEGLHIIIRKTIGRSLLAIQVELLQPGGIDIDPAPVGADPEVALAVLEQRRDGPLGKTAPVTGLVGIMKEGTRRSMKKIESPVDAPRPELPLVVGKHTFDHIIPQTRCIRVGMTISGEGLPQRVEKIKPVVLCPQPEIALPVLPDGDDGIAAGVCDLGVGHGREQPRFRMENVEPRLRTNPYSSIPALILLQTIDPVVPQRPCTAAHPEMPEAARLFIEKIHAPGGRNPDMSAMILQQGGDIAAAQAAAVGIPVLPPGKPVLCPVKPVEPIHRSDPELMIPVFQDTTDIPVADTPAVGRVIPVYDDLMTVIAVQPVPGPDPDKSLTVLVDGLDGAVG